MRVVVYCSEGLGHLAEDYNSGVIKLINYPFGAAGCTLLYLCLPLN
jgi:hypothetical protein